MLYSKVKKTHYFFSELYNYASEGGTPSTSQANYYEGGTIPFAKIDDLGQHYIFSTKANITELGLSKSSAWLVPVNSVLFSNGATIGACAINKVCLATKQGILGIVPSSLCCSDYLYFYFQSSYFLKKVKAITTKGTMDCAYLKDLNKLYIGLPSIEEQYKIVEILNNATASIEKQEGIYIKLKEIKNALLQNIFI